MTPEINYYSLSHAPQWAVGVLRDLGRISRGDCCEMKLEVVRSPLLVLKRLTDAGPPPCDLPVFAKGITTRGGFQDLPVVFSSGKNVGCGTSGTAKMTLQGGLSSFRAPLCLPSPLWETCTSTKRRTDSLKWQCVIILREVLFSSTFWTSISLLPWRKETRTTLAKMMYKINNYPVMFLGN